MIIFLIFAGDRDAGGAAYNFGSWQPQTPDQVQFKNDMLGYTNYHEIYEQGWETCNLVNDYNVPKMALPVQIDKIVIINSEI